MENHQCPVCGSRTKILRRKVSGPENRGSLDNQIIKQILNLDTVEHQLRFCPHCLHMFRWPLYDELAVVEKQLQESQETKRRTTEHVLKYTLGVLMDDAMMRLSKLVKIADFLKAQNFDAERVKILDWGGGTGVVSHIFSLLFNKSSNIPAMAYSYDINSQFGNYPSSPYIKYIGHDKIKDEAPYDILIMSHVLEHVALPVELTKEAVSYLSPNGVLLVVLPYEQDGALSPSSAYLSPHMHLYSQRSTLELLKSVGFRNVKVSEIDAFNKHWLVEDDASRKLLGKTFKVKNIIAYGIYKEANKGNDIRRETIIYLSSCRAFVIGVLMKVWGKIRALTG